MRFKSLKAGNNYASIDFERSEEKLQKEKKKKIKKKD